MKHKIILFGIMLLVLIVGIVLIGTKKKSNTRLSQETTTEIVLPEENSENQSQSDDISSEKSTDMEIEDEYEIELEDGMVGGGL